MNHNQRFCELAGICWHEQVRVTSDAEIICSCGATFYPCQFTEHRKSNPDFAAEPWRVLEVMRERKDWKKFLEQIGRTTVYEKEVVYIDLILDRTGELRDAAIEWMEGRKGNGGYR